MRIIYGKKHDWIMEEGHWKESLFIKDTQSSFYIPKQVKEGIEELN
jgi:hypothetical protein